jgi:methyltransferase (TIGR00027 family)
MGAVETDSPASRTALGAARHRAVHQLLEGGVIFTDPLAVPVTGDDPAWLAARALEEADRRMRWFVCARSRYAEDTLARAVSAGVDQLVVLGAGLDTFAYRNPFRDLRVTELAHPATQAWKLECLAAADIAVPGSVRHVPVDFGRDRLADVLAASIDPSRPVLFWWLGVTPYLTAEAVRGTLTVLGSLPHVAVVLDHASPTSAETAEAQDWMRRRRERVAGLGEPWLSEFTAEEIPGLLRACGLDDVRVEDEGVLIRRLLGLPPSTSPRATHLALASTGWPTTGEGRAQRL